MFNTKVILAVVGVVILMLVVGGVAFAAGNAYGNAQAQNTRAEFFQSRGGFQGQGAQAGQSATGGQNQPNGQAGRGGAQGRIAAAGTVKSVSGNTIEVTGQNGNSVTVTLDSQTRIEKTVSGAIGDIQTGERVLVMSDQTGDKVTARSIAIQPQQATQ